MSSGLRAARWAAGILCLVALGAASPVLARCQMQELGEIAVQTIDGAPVVQAEIDGRPVALVVETGAQESFLFRSGAKALHLVEHPLTGVTAYGVGGAERGYSVRVQSLQFAGASARGVELMVINHTALGDAQGVLGGDMLNQSDVEFDLPAGKIRLFKPLGCAGDEVVYWGAAYSVTDLLPTLRNDLQVYVSVNGAKVRAQLASGAAYSVLTSNGAALAGVTRDSPAATTDVRIGGVGREKARSWTAVFSSFAIGDETIRNAKLRFADLFAADKETSVTNFVPALKIDTPQMLLGADFLRAHRVYVARSQHRLYVSYQGGPVFDTTHPATDSPGFRLETTAPGGCCRPL